MDSACVQLGSSRRLKINNYYVVKTGVEKSVRYYCLLCMPQHRKRMRAPAALGYSFACLGAGIIFQSHPD